VEFQLNRLYKYTCWTSGHVKLESPSILTEKNLFARPIGGGAGPHPHPLVYASAHLFCRVHGRVQRIHRQTDKQTDRQTDHGKSVSIGRMLVLCKAMPPNDSCTLYVHGRPHIWANGAADPLKKIDEKLKSENILIIMFMLYFFRTQCRQV